MFYYLGDAITERTELFVEIDRRVRAGRISLSANPNTTKLVTIRKEATKLLPITSALLQSSD